MEVIEDITPEYAEKEINELLKHFSTNTYDATATYTSEPRPYLSDSIKLLEKDYSIVKLDNKLGKLCPQYPEIIPIMESPRSVTTIFENTDEVETVTLDLSKIAELCEGAKIARCRQRFVVPVILFNGKYVCRSSTLASKPEMCYRTGLSNVAGYELLNSVKEFWWPDEGLEMSSNEDETAGSEPYDDDAKVKTICDKLRNLDIKLLKMYNVKSIVDIMVENRKYKHSLCVSASEKVDAARYSSFDLICLPYPGCEFFKDYHDANYQARGLVYDWESPLNDAVISVPDDNINRGLGISWEQYKKWDLIRITKNYMKYILNRLEEDSSGLLLHCISGWDRTPLFISLIRLSLWADGLIHRSLNAHEILYFTLAYDWYLFGHHLSNRLYKTEEIMAFCFDFLRHLGDIKYSAIRRCSGESRSELTAEEGDAPVQGSRSSSTDPEAPLDAHETSTDSNASDTSDERITAEITDPLRNDSDSEDMNCGKTPSPTSPSQIRTPPAGGRRRTESTGSLEIIGDTGSVEKEYSSKPLRVQRLQKVRTIFSSCYQKTVKNETFGPPKKSLVEEVVSCIPVWSDWSRYLSMPKAITGGDADGDNGSIETLPVSESNGNSAENNETDKTG
ncbi:myotubularin-related protein 14 [Dendroctonus ponderosae]|uniref:myotubularin-related protein 14 n=1 Tax=Dendroctonus ponderosae TaxID=77166 RepID=UPI002034FD17|nr:myotubularin-related protein 14 [Dendroctonus ponderosae]KAH1029369.1 hypothetical protein HUJ05_002625 [Dendroctonus ponderosae]